MLPGAGTVAGAGIGAFGGAVLGREVGEFVLFQYRLLTGDYHWTCPKALVSQKFAQLIFRQAFLFRMP